MNKSILIVIIGLVVLVGGYFLLRGGYQTPAPSTTAPQTPQRFTPVPQATKQAPQQQAAREIAVVGTEFAFSPSTITLKAGERVKVSFRNGGQVIHNWIVERQGIGTQTIAGGANDSVEFTAPAAGTYTYFCSVPGHRERGMVGTLKVE